MSRRCDRIASYPTEHWNVAATLRWLALVEELRQWTPPATALVLERDRKWEVVSGYQKSVRRGLAEWAQQLAGAALSFGPAEHKYFWTRITTTACEDVGFGDPELVRFVLACAALFPPSVGEPLTTHVWSFVTARMCEAQRSRIFCQLSLLEDWTEREHLPPPSSLTAWDQAVLGEINQLSSKTHPLWTATPFHAWHKRTNWRGQNMLKFAVYPTALAPEQVVAEPPPFEVLCRLPDFSYDMHTRVGKRTYRRACNIAAVGEFFREHPTPRRTETIGWGLFMVEGGFVRQGLVDHRLSLLEHRFLASRWGWTPRTWLTFQELLGSLLREGVINRLRREVLNDASL